MLWPARTSPRGHSLSSPRGRLTLQAAATRHRLTMQALRLAVRRGQLPVLRAGRTLWVSEADLAAFLATYHTHAAGSPPGSAAPPALSSTALESAESAGASPRHAAA